MDYPKLVKDAPKADPPKRQTLTEWIADVCRVKETTAPYPVGMEIFTGCIDGLVHPEVRGYTVAFRCPVCSRAVETYPKVKVWMGSYKVYTDEEYRKILQQRAETAGGIRSGRARTPEIDTEHIGA
ncbi:MAG: hypothetical protein IH577_04495 [Deltaproteobacteria bacterium]|nr:hypothetical protein [Deltaproteobacteria bacterium]